MATQTPNLGLKKPEKTDFYNVDDFNENMDIIDMYLSDTGWVSAEIDFTNATTAPPNQHDYEYRCVGKRVEIRGNYYANKSGTKTITIPQKYAPSTTLMLCRAFGSNGAQNITIGANGVIEIIMNDESEYPMASICVDGISWFMG